MPTLSLSPSRTAQAHGSVAPTTVLDAPTAGPGPTAVPPGNAAPAPRANTPTAPPPGTEGRAARRRDGFVDAVRAVGTVLVVLLHWLMVDAAWDGERLLVDNALGHGAAWLLTWAQPLPVLFFAAGASAAFQLARRPDATGRAFAADRVRSMLPPVLVLATGWGVLVFVLPLLGVPAQAVSRAARIAPQPLWFIGVQAALLALTPLAARALDRCGWWLPAGLALAACGVDVLRFAADVPGIGAVNLLLVWAVPYLVGVRYARGGARVRPRTALLVAAGALAATVVLLVAGPYPRALIGMPGDAVSNLSPPTAPVVTFAVAQVAVALAARTVLERWGSRSRLVARVQAQSMGLYLWHLTAMFLVCGVLIFGFGQVLPEPWTAAWWLTWPLMAAAAAAVLGGLVRLSGTVRALVAHGQLPAARAGLAGCSTGGSSSRSTS